MDNTIKKIIAGFLLAFALNLSLVVAVASFEVTSFSCSPSESVISSVFSCTAKIKNAGDASGAVSVATLYPDSNDWLENSNYPQSSGTSVSPGQTTDVTFTGLRAVKAGNNGFSKIMLDSVTDNYVANNNKKVNVINVAVTVSNSASSAAMNGNVTSTAEVTAGGNIDVSLEFTSTSGGCSIGSQSNPKTISGMTDGSKQARTWTITQGTSGSCKYTVSAAATGVGGIASKIDSTPSTITCTNCPTQTSGSSSSSSGGGGGASRVYILGEIVLGESQISSLYTGDKISFNISKKEHTLTLINHTETRALVSIMSKLQKFNIEVGNEVNVDLDEDGIADVSVKLKSINIISQKVSFILTRVSGGEVSAGLVEGAVESNNKVGGVKSEAETGGSAEDREKLISLYYWIALFAVLAVVSLYYYLRMKKRREFGIR
jgi:hypothetical protein